MLFSSWPRNSKCSVPAARRYARSSSRQPAGIHPRLEGLEDRKLLTTYTASSVSALIADINAANKAGGSNTIILAPGTTFDLKTANNTTNGANGLPVIGGTKAGDLTIVGNGDTVERVGGVSYAKRGTPSNPFRLFDVAPGASLTLQSVRLQGGWAYGSVGGAVYNQGTLTLSNSTVSTMTGGGIYNGGGTMTVSGSTLTNISGGAISNSGGTATVSNSTLSGNSATSGGGIYNGGGTVTVSGSTLSGNGATYGGGIYNAGGTVTVSGSTLSKNSATYGGGIYNAGGTVTVSNGGTLSGNYTTPDYSGHGGFGGGIYNSGGTLLISNSILSGNTAYQFGLYSTSGGIYNDATGTVTVKNASGITGNTAGGGADDWPVAQDVYNLGVLYLDVTSTIGVVDGNPAIRI